MPFDADAFLARVTRKPGVYQMLDDTGRVLYVGKARNLKSRLASYFRASGLNSKTMALVARIADIRVTVTGSETEALLLEQSLIKSQRPPYNIVLRDDKSYPYIYLTPDPEFPRLCFHRGARQKRGRYFGPFPSAGAVRDSLGILQKLFRIRQCEDAYFRNRTRPCLQYQIQRCSAPCVGFIDAEEYQRDVRHAVMFLEGRNQAILDEFKAAMEAAAQRLEYEKAARLRDQIQHLTRVQEAQHVHAAEGDVDVVAVADGAGAACIEVLYIRSGRLLGDRTWFPKDALSSAPAELLSAFLSQYYLAGSGAADLPRRLIVSHEVADADILEAALAAAGGRRIEISTRVRGTRRRWLDLALANAEQSLGSHLADRQNVYARFEALQAALGLPELPMRLECFDVSHSHGEATVASCVVFDRNGPRKSDYRRFNIEGVAPGDDYAAMAQALRRRYTRLKSGEGMLPDVLLIDGGKGQLSAAESVLEDLQVQGVTLLGVAKGMARKPGLETLWLGDRESALDLSADDPAMHLIQHIRDEAHRFAITAHRNRRSKRRNASELDGIAGVGPKRRRELLRHFGGLRGVKGASTSELAKVPGISHKLADEIYARLHSD